VPIVLTVPAIDDLRRVGPVLAPRVLDLIASLAAEPLAGTPLVDESTGYRVLTAERGRHRVVHSVHDDDVTVCAVWVDGARLDGEAYAEALDRMQAADAPDVVQLARILRRLGRLVGTVAVPADRVRAPVPDWLADALVADAGFDVLTVAALDARTAFAAWNTRRPER
jgi:hypothetical protein